jgi:hypothetical protein
MADSKITDLAPNLDPVDVDLLEMVDDPAGVPVNVKVTKADFLKVLQAEVDLNTAKVSADGPVTTHNDVTNAGSGQIITTAERNAITVNTAKISADGSIDTHVDVDTSTSPPDIGDALEWNGTNWVPEPHPGGGGGTYNDVEKDSVSISTLRSKLDFRDTGDATVTVTDDPANDRTIISIDATAGAGPSGDVVGPASAVDSNFAAFDGITGKLIKDAGTSAATFATAAQGALADTATQPGDNVSTLTNDAGYTDDQTGAEIKVAYEGEADTNAFTDAEQTKVAASITEVSDDATPQLGGNLDYNTHGMVVVQQAGEAIAALDCCYFNSATGKVNPAQGDVIGTSNGVLFFATAVYALDESGPFMLEGVLEGFVGLTAGAPYYLSETVPGGIQTTPPSGGSIARLVGMAKSTTELIVKADATVITTTV